MLLQMLFSCTAPFLSAHEGSRHCTDAGIVLISCKTILDPNCPPATPAAPCPPCCTLPASTPHTLLKRYLPCPIPLHAAPCLQAGLPVAPWLPPAIKLHYLPWRLYKQTLSAAP